MVFFYFFLDTMFAAHALVYRFEFFIFDIYIKDELNKQRKPTKVFFMVVLVSHENSKIMMNGDEWNFCINKTFIIHRVGKD